MTIAYDGTQYGGWQIQPNAVSIQSLIQNALSLILRNETTITGAGRTDAGVHAEGQRAHFDSVASIDLHKTIRSLNGILPPDIRIVDLQMAPDDFHARYSAASKTYYYHLHLDRTADPFKRHYCLHVLHKVDLSLLREAAQYFIGSHDFSSFANEAHLGAAAKDPVRTLKRLDIVEEKGGVRLEFEADGFLYRMVRNIVGTLLDVCGGRFKAQEIPKILQAKDRRMAGKSAPAHGLFLMHVRYASEEEASITSNEGKLSTLLSSNSF
jgi:tRNA pseudouridine38-40 synthase